MVRLKRFLWRYPRQQEESVMGRFRAGPPVDLFVPEVPLSASAREALLPLLAARITAVMASTQPKMGETEEADND